jgi:hypothetical protein
MATEVVVSEAVGSVAVSGATVLQTQPDLIRTRAELIMDLVVSADPAGTGQTVQLRTFHRPAHGRRMVGSKRRFSTCRCDFSVTIGLRVQKVFFR